MLQKLLRSAILASSAVLLIAAPVFAHAGHDHSEELANNEQRAALGERVQGKLDETRRKNCDARKTAVTRIMNQSASQGQKHLATFTAILKRIQNFYIDKELAVANYDSLVVAAEAKKATAQSAVNDVKAGITLECEGNNPIGQVDAFRSKLKAMYQALKDYRTAIKEVGQAVKAAASSERSN